jgi:hypothetical protein
MSFQVTSKLEVNLLNTKTSPQIASDFAIKNRVPAIVAAPEYVAPLIAHRSMMGGGYKIICALDFPKGSNFAMDKLFRANPDFVAADGYDILLSTGRSAIESRNEMKAIHSYLKANRPLCDIRWCLRMHAPDATDEVIGILKNMSKHPPSFVRVDPHLDTPNSDLDKLLAHVALIKEHVPYPIKIGGNVTPEVMKAFEEERTAKRFDVSMDQAVAILNELKAGVKTNAPVPESEPQKGPAVKNTGPKIKI